VLGELSMRVQSIARDRGKGLLVGHAQGDITALPVPQAKQVIAHHVPATGLFPDFRGMQSWEQEFLSPDAVHLLSDDAYYLEADALSQRQEMNRIRSEEHTSELQSLTNLVCRLLLEKKKYELLEDELHRSP